MSADGNAPHKGDEPEYMEFLFSDPGVVEKDIADALMAAFPSPPAYSSESIDRIADVVNSVMDKHVIRLRLKG